MAETIEFYDLRTKKKFSTNKYEIETRNGRRIAFAISPSGIRAARILGR
jgi:hypothetical protein